MENIKLKPKKYVQRAINNILENYIILRCSHISITNYKLGDNYQFEKSISIWNDIYHSYQLKAGYYIEEFNEFRLNRGYPIDLLARYFPNHKVIVDYKYSTADELVIDLKVPPKNDFQMIAITHMLSKGKYEKLAKYTQQVIDADTGDGKTYCGVAASCFLKGNVVVIVPRAKLVDQWIQSYLMFTNIDKDDIIYIKGSSMCEELRNGKYRKHHIFIFIGSTIQSYNKKYGNIATMQMLGMTHAYTKIIDEVHMNFGITNMIDALSNIRMTYYMSASFGRTGDESRIFNMLFKNIPKFGSTFKHQSEKHINIIIKKYEYIPSSHEKSMMYNNKKGLNIKLYEKTMMESQNNKSFNESILIMVEWSLSKISPNNKILILCSTKQGTSYIRDLLLANELVDIDDIGIYHSEVSKKDKEISLTKKIIISTDGSLGTGADVIGIEHIHNIITYSTFIYAKQLPGRGRAIDDRKIIYIEYVNFAYLSTARQYKKRRPFLEKNTPTGKLTIID